MPSILSWWANGPPLHPPRWCRPCRPGPLAAALLSLGMAGLAWAGPAQPPAPDLTLEMALAAAQTRSATLLAQEAAARASREMAVAAGRLPDPELRLSVSNLPIEGPMRYSLTDDFMTMRSVEWMQTHVSPGKRQARSLRFTREAELATATRDLQAAQVRTQTALAWFERHFQEQTLQLLQSQREETLAWVEAVQAGYRSGRNEQADVLAARSAAARLDDQLQESTVELANARAVLQRWAGDAAARPLGPAPRIDRMGLPAHPSVQGVDRHPSIAVMDARERVALAEADVAKQEKSADWSWSLMYSKRGRQFGDMVSVGVSIPLQWDQARRQDRELAAKLAQIEQAQAEREEARREHLAAIQRLFASWRGDLARLEGYDQTLIPLAVDRVQSLVAAFRGGKATLAQVLEARRMLIETRLERLRIERQTAAWWAELEFLIPQESRP